MCQCGQCIAAWQIDVWFAFISLVFIFSLQQKRIIRKFVKFQIEVKKLKKKLNFIILFCLLQLQRMKGLQFLFYAYNCLPAFAGSRGGTLFFFFFVFPLISLLSAIALRMLYLFVCAYIFYFFSQCFVAPLARLWQPNCQSWHCLLLLLRLSEILVVSVVCLLAF